MTRARRAAPVGPSPHLRVYDEGRAERRENPYLVDVLDRHRSAGCLREPERHLEVPYAHVLLYFDRRGREQNPKAPDLDAARELGIIRVEREEQTVAGGGVHPIIVSAARQLLLDARMGEFADAV